MTIVWRENGPFDWELIFTSPVSGKERSFSYISEEECIKAANGLMDAFCEIPE